MLVNRLDKRQSIATGAVVGIVVVMVVAAITGYFLLTSAGGPVSSSSTTPTTMSTVSSGSATIVRVSIPHGAGTNQSVNFQPATITVIVGVNNTIQWDNQDSVPHTVVSTSVPTGGQSFDSSALSQGQTYQIALTVPGTYKYYCTIHPTWMLGKIIVIAAN